MRLGYFTMPVHPMHRDWSQTLREDREAIILADKLGFHDAFVGEHLTDAIVHVFDQARLGDLYDAVQQGCAEDFPLLFPQCGMRGDRSAWRERLDEWLFVL